MNIQSGGNTPATAFYPEHGVTIAFVLYFGLWIIPLIPINIIITLLKNNYNDYSLIVLPLVTIIGYGGACFLLKKMNFDLQLRRFRDASQFLLITVLGSLFIAITFGYARIVLGHETITDFFKFIVTWFIGDMVGIYALTPLLLIIIFPFFNEYIKKELIKSNLKIIANIIGLCLILVTFFTFIIFLSQVAGLPTLFYLFFIPLIISASIFRLKGSIVANNIIIYESIIMLKFMVFTDSIIEFQISLFALSAVALTIGSVLTEREDAIDELNNQKSNIEILVKKRTLELETAVDDLKLFSYSLSHDLRTPLKGIDGIIDLLLNNSETFSKEEFKQLILKLKSRTTNMEGFINNLMDFFLLTNKRTEKTIIQMNELINDVMESFSYEIKKKNIQIKINSIPNCFGDIILLKVVWTNLISNAIKYTSQISEAVIEINHIVENNREIFYIQDNGVGFDMKNYNKLFNVFQRLHGDDFEGMGIGLALVKRIIINHGGDIWAKSEVGKGTTFYFVI
jgi:signal transduction histidine kinase